MSKLIVRLFKEKSLIAEASNIQLEYIATTTFRIFYLEDVTFVKNDLTLYRNHHVEILIYFLDDKLENDRQVVGGFDITLRLINDQFLSNFTQKNEGLLKLEGAVSSETDYSQGEINVYKSWQIGKEINWWDLPFDISILDYIMVCLKYSTISSIKPKKELVKIDFKNIKSELAFSCAFAEEYLGKRAYMGRYLDTFQDCLLTLYDSDNKYFDNVTVILIYKELNLNDTMCKIIVEVIEILNKFKFNIIEE
ncbi:hypothetical protein Fleli_3372 [Bernardetia litoralis DSM 6794]|nr:hypothetical protein Fleli_3372 [Bernardetia litoralis DSM 6794]